MSTQDIERIKKMKAQLMRIQKTRKGQTRIMQTGRKTTILGR